MATGDELHRLVDALRDRASKLKESARFCSNVEDCFALWVRADEAERCVASIEKIDLAQNRR